MRSLRGSSQSERRPSGTGLFVDNFDASEIVRERVQLLTNGSRIAVPGCDLHRAADFGDRFEAISGFGALHAVCSKLDGLEVFLRERFADRDDVSLTVFQEARDQVRDVGV